MAHDRFSLISISHHSHTTVRSKFLFLEPSLSVRNHQSISIESDFLSPLTANLRTIIFTTNFVFCALYANFSAGILFCLCCCISRTIFSKTIGCSNRRDNTSDVIDPAVNVELHIPAATSVHDNGQDSHSQRGIINSHSQQHYESSWKRATDSTV